MTPTWESRDLPILRAIVEMSDEGAADRRTVGTWPAPEDRVAELIEALRQAAETAPDPETKGALRKAAAYAGGMGRDIIVGIIANLATRG